ncbi:hypothetical protein U0070_021919 [Myodes glareolus]|uniref:Cytochrome c oxidase subunit 5A, mitochondrial n=1 Tax=Myodes glareolus TaxID=447135 RepID=A0AAW0IFG9_MYOGA
MGYLVYKLPSDIDYTSYFNTGALDYRNVNGVEDHVRVKSFSEMFMEASNIQSLPPVPLLSSLSTATVSGFENIDGYDQVSESTITDAVLQSCRQGNGLASTVHILEVVKDKAGPHKGIYPYWTSSYPKMYVGHGKHQAQPMSGLGFPTLPKSVPSARRDTCALGTQVKSITS